MARLTPTGPYCCRATVRTPPRHRRLRGNRPGPNNPLGGPTAAHGLRSARAKILNDVQPQKVAGTPDALFAHPSNIFQRPQTGTPVAIVQGVAVTNSNGQIQKGTREKRETNEPLMTARARRHRPRGLPPFAPHLIPPALRPTRPPSRDPPTATQAATTSPAAAPNPAP
jgi:hypothetical protein